MERQKRGRAVVRRNATRLMSDANDELAKEVPDAVILQVELERLKEVKEELQNHDEAIINAMLDGDAPEDQCDEESRVTGDYQKNLMIVIGKINRSLPPLLLPMAQGDQQSHHHSSISGDKRRQYQLPKIKIKSFDGNVKNWLSFWSQFEKIHADEDLHTSDKFQYLVQSIEEGTRARRLVESYPQTGDNYQKVVSALQDRFGDKVLLAEVYVRELLKFVNTNLKSASLSSMFDELESHLRSLETLGVTANQSAIFLYPMVESSLPLEILKVWQRSQLSGYGDEDREVNATERLKNLMKFLKQEVKGEERLQYVSEGVTDNRKKAVSKEYKGTDVPTVSGLFVGDKVRCVFCEKTHESKDCYKAQTMSIEAKNKIIREKRCCFICLRQGHSSNKCKSNVKCMVCSKKHTTIMCPELPSHNTSERKKVEESGSGTKIVIQSLVCSTETVLKTLLVKIEGSRGHKMVRALLDDGSHRSYVTESVAEEVGLNIVGQERLQHSLFGAVQTAPEDFNQLEVRLTCSTTNVEFRYKALVKSDICCDIARVQKGDWMRYLKEKNILMSDIGDGHQNIDLLIGAKQLAKLYTGRMEEITPGLVAIETHLGWTMMGESPFSRNSTSAAMNVTSLHVSQMNIQQLWDLETIGIQDSAQVQSKEERDEQVRRHFLQNVSRTQEGRYSVALPWTNGKQSLPDNRLVAERRLDSTTRKLLSLQKFEVYEDIFQKWLEEDIIEEVPEEQWSVPAHYLPHHAVFKPQSLTTPVRPVFDASCKTGRSPSLNECLEKGPNFLELIPNVLIRFRIGKFGAISDIRKAFLMIEVNEDDRDCIRFLWWRNHDKKEYRVYRHKRVVFGINSSPYLLGAVIQNHLQLYHKDPSEKWAADLLWKSLYVDNCVVSFETLDEYEDFKERTTRMIKDAGMDLRLWQCSTGEEARVGLLSSDCRLATDSSNTADEVSTVLGLKWNVSQDYLYVDLNLKTNPDIISKRFILSTVQQVFDPIGFTCPALIVPKLLLQEEWLRKTSWDEEIQETGKKQFLKWIEQMSDLKKMTVPRNVTNCISDKSKWQVHHFCDASSAAYATCVYLRTEDKGQVSVQLLAAKSRVAPLKKVTIPRLELLGCTIGSRLVDSIWKALSLGEVPIYHWSDSSTALAWIKRNDEWGTFVGNRVKEIISLTKPEDWRHVPGKLNPADLPSRGCSPAELLSSRWWEGPSWLRLPPEQWPMAEVIFNEDEINKEKKKTCTPVTSMTNCVTKSSEFLRHSSYKKNLRVLALVRRFIKKCQRKPTFSSHVHLEEIEEAEKNLIKIVQSESFSKNIESGGINSFIDVSGILRVKTKLLYRDDAPGFKTPMLLPHNHPVVDLIVHEEHIQNSHGGIQFLMGKIREKFWIVRGRKAIRRIIQKCMKCRRFSSRKVATPPTSLPEDRVSTGRVFETVGVDLAGPLFVKGNKKVWIVLFTCSVYRCVHLDLVRALSTEAFLEVFNNFMCRRGRPVTVYSDNGRNFVGTDNLFAEIDWDRISEECGLKQISWKFIPPSAAWWGGWWERLIGSVKEILRRVLGKGTLSFEKLRNVLVDAEAVVNGRPLTTVTEDPNDLQPLTPSMFLHEMPCPGITDLDLLEVSGFQRIFSTRKKIVEELKQRFRKEYLSLLVQRGKENSTKLNTGDIVLVGADNKKRWEWPIGRIMELIPGKDGHSRVAKVRTSSGEWIRPVQRLFPMEVSSPTLRPLN